MIVTPLSRCILLLTLVQINNVDAGGSSSSGRISNEQRSVSPPRVDPKHSGRFPTDESFYRQQSHVRARYGIPEEKHKIRRRGRWLNHPNGLTNAEALAGHQVTQAAGQRKRYFSRRPSSDHLRTSPPRPQEKHQELFTTDEEFQRQKSHVRARYSDPEKPHKILRGGAWIKDPSGISSGEFYAEHVRTKLTTERKRYHERKYTGNEEWEQWLGGPRKRGRPTKFMEMYSAESGAQNSANTHTQAEH